MTEPNIMQKVRELCLSCQDCKHFMRHYIKSSAYPSSTNGFSPLTRGHCMSPNRRRPSIAASDEACIHFEPKEGVFG